MINLRIKKKNNEKKKENKMKKIILITYIISSFSFTVLNADDCTTFLNKLKNPKCFIGKKSEIDAKKKNFDEKNKTFADVFRNMKK